MSLKEYQLSQTIVTDAEPIRSVSCTGTHLISGSESGVLSAIGLNSVSGAQEVQVLNTGSITIQPGGDGTRHSHHITAILGSHNNTSSTGATNDKDTGTGTGTDTDTGTIDVYVTGCKDKLIRIFDASNHQLIHKLSGHDNAVTSLSWLSMPTNNKNDNDNYTKILISGSWDGTAKLWNVQTGQCLATLEGHENTVSVQGLPPFQNGDVGIGRIATGSAGIANGNQIMDHKIRLWEVKCGESGGDAVYSVQLKTTVGNDHDGPIRGLAYDPTSQMLLSCSNDGTVKVRDIITGEAVTTLACPHGQGQPPMLLSVSSIGDGKVVAGAEDGSVIVWNTQDGAVQVISHPNCVWHVTSMNTNANVNSNTNTNVGANNNSNSNSSGDFITACHDGMLRVFTTTEARVAPQSEQEAFQDAVLAARSKSSSGPSKEEIDALPKWEMNLAHFGKSEGQVQVFNKGGKAIAAQWSNTSGTWIEVGEVTGTNENAGTIDGTTYDHVFPIEIDVAGGGVQKMQIGYNNGENPFVVAQKFIDDYQLDQGYLAQIADYIRNRVGEPAAPTLGMAGANGTSNASVSAVSSGPVPMDISENPKTPAYSYLPMKGYKAFETGADMKVLSKVSTKIREFNTTLNTNLSQELISTGLDGLCQTIAATSRYHATTISNDELSIVLKMMQDWSLEQIFPSIDLARLAVLHPDASKSSRSEFWNRIVTCALDKCEALLASDVQGTPRTAIPMLSFRLFANCFKGGVGSQSAVELNLTR